MIMRQVTIAMGTSREQRLMNDMKFNAQFYSNNIMCGARMKESKITDEVASVSPISNANMKGETRRLLKAERTVNEHELHTVSMFCNSALFHACDKCADLIVEIIGRANHYKTLQSKHKSIPCRNAIRDYVHKQYRRFVDNCGFCSDKRNEVTDRAMEEIINPLWKDVESVMSNMCNQYVLQHPEIACAIHKCGTDVNFLAQIDQCLFMIKIYDCILRKCNTMLLNTGCGQKVSDSNTFRMLDAEKMLNKYKYLVFGDIDIEYDHAVMIELFDGMVNAITDERNIVECEQPGEIEKACKEFDDYNDMKRRHPDMPDDALYEEFRRTTNHDCVEKKIATQMVEKFTASIKEADGKTNLPCNDKDKCTVFELLVEAANDKLKPIIENDLYLKDMAEKKNEELGFLVTHPTASYRVMESMLLRRMPKDYQDAVLKERGKQQLKMMKRQVKTAQA